MGEVNEAEPVPAASAPPAVPPPAPPPPPTVVPTPLNPPVSPPVTAPATNRTQLQVSSARLLHVQTDTTIELPANLTVVHIGKPNDRIPPDIDVSGFPDSEIVSRIHADIRVEGGIYYIEDVGSSNGTYINNAPLPMGNRHRLRAGDRIALGKGDRVTFLFQT
jgi:pSer/pThr/pTyr-binding forkhead associated (FHA) protein